MPDINASAAILCAHPFTLVGLSDREKFHTGMLAHTLRRLFETDREAGLDLVRALWGDVNSLLPLRQARTIDVVVEDRSVDLSIRADRQTLLFAEMKLKTGLADHQLEKYRKTHPAASGVVLGLFCEDTGDSNTPSRKFPDILSQNLGSGLLERRFAESRDDADILIRIWADYLQHLALLGNEFETGQLLQIDQRRDFEAMLAALRIKGIFEAYRYRLIARELAKLNCPVVGAAINTHGSAGLHFGIEADMPFGLQWQGEIVKLFVEDRAYVKGVSAAMRDERLLNLAARYLARFSHSAEVKLNKAGKFRSVTVHNQWNVFDDCAGRAEALMQGLSFLASPDAL